MKRQSQNLFIFNLVVWCIFVASNYGNIKINLQHLHKGAIFLDAI